MFLLAARVLGGEASSACVAFAFVFGIAGACLAYRQHVLDHAQYVRRVSCGSFHRGVIVFASGDIVLRSETLFAEKELAFDKDDIEEVRLVESSTLVSQMLSCSQRKVSVFLHFKVRGLDGQSVRNHYIDCATLRDAPDAILEHIHSIL
eukprot:g495.t1